MLALTSRASILRPAVVQEDFMKAVRKMLEAKKLEPSAAYDSSFKQSD